MAAASETGAKAVTHGRPAVVIVRDCDLLGHGGAADAALANGLLGLVRALATEGLREQWVVNMLAIETDTDAQAEEIAETVAFLSSSAASYVTGQVLVACGGRSIAP